MEKEPNIIIANKRILIQHVKIKTSIPLFNKINGRIEVMGLGIHEGWSINIRDCDIEFIPD